MRSLADGAMLQLLKKLDSSRKMLKRRQQRGKRAQREGERGGVVVCAACRRSRRGVHARAAVGALSMAAGRAALVVLGFCARRLLGADLLVRRLFAHEMEACGWRCTSHTAPRSARPWWGQRGPWAPHLALPLLFFNRQPAHHCSIGWTRAYRRRCRTLALPYRCRRLARPQRPYHPPRPPTLAHHRARDTRHWTLDTEHSQSLSITLNHSQQTGARDQIRFAFCICCIAA